MFDIVVQSYNLSQKWFRIIKEVVIDANGMNTKNGKTQQVHSMLNAIISKMMINVHHITNQMKGTQ